MVLWVDAHRPTQLEKLSYHKEQADGLREMVKQDDFPHLLVYGPDGAGKKTRIRCILRELYGAGADRLRIDTQAFTAPSGKKLEIQTVNSNYHIELSPGDVGIYDRVVVMEVVKQMAQSGQIDAASQKRFKVVVLNEVDQLTRDAQHALRRTMEKYSRNCRLVLCCESLSRVIEPLRSRCMAVRVAAPEDDEVRACIRYVCEKESVNFSDDVIDQVVEKSRGNLRRALLLLEATRAQGNVGKEYKVPEPEWETYIRETAELIIKKQSGEALMQVRERLYELLSRCIPANVIFVYLLRCLLPFCSEKARFEVISEAARFEHRLTRGNKAVMHIEAFVAAFMEIFQRTTAENTMDMS